MLRDIVLFILPLILCVSTQYWQYNGDNIGAYSGYIQPPQPPALPTQITPNLQEVPCQDDANIMYVMYGQPPATAATQPPVEILHEPSPVIVETQASSQYVPTQIIPNHQELPCHDYASIMYDQPPATAATQPPVEILHEPSPVIVETQAPSQYVPTQIIPNHQESPCHECESIIYNQPPATAATQPPVEILHEPSPVIVETQAPSQYVPTQIIPYHQESPCHECESIIYNQPPATAATQPPVESLSKPSPVIVEIQMPPGYATTQSPAPTTTPKSVKIVLMGSAPKANSTDPIKNKNQTETSPKKSPVVYLLTQE